MKFAFFAGSLVPFHAKSLEERPLGGTETGLIRLSEALQALGHDVTVFTSLENPPESSPRYLPIRMVESFPEVDCFTVVRDWIPAFYRIPAKRRFVWTGDSFDQFVNFGLGDKRVAGALDALLTVSNWQADKLCEASGFPRAKAWKLGNGIDLKLFEGKEAKVRRRLIYSSTPYRGLRHIPQFFAALKKKFHDLECHIFSGYKIYDQTGDQKFEELVFMLRAQPGVEVHDSILQGRLAREFMKSSILFYPCEFEETSCITAKEAMAAGAVVLSSKLGALPETLGEAGVLIDGLPGNPDYDQKFLLAAEELLSNDQLFEKYSMLGKQRAANLGWDSIAKNFVEFIERLPPSKVGQ